jgi:hypothetical protein
VARLSGIEVETPAVEQRVPTPKGPSPLPGTKSDSEAASEQVDESLGQRAARVPASKTPSGDGTPEGLVAKHHQNYLRQFVRSERLGQAFLEASIQ